MALSDAELFIAKLSGDGESEFREKLRVVL